MLKYIKMSQIKNSIKFKKIKFNKIIKNNNKKKKIKIIMRNMINKIILKNKESKIERRKMKMKTKTEIKNIINTEIIIKQIKS